MSAYDPKRPRPSRPSDEPAPVEALLEPASPAEAAEPSDGAEAESRSTAGSRNGSGPPARPAGSAQEVPVAPAPEVGTTNRAVLYASLGVAALVAVVLVVLRVRSRRADGSTGG